MPKAKRLCCRPGCRRQATKFDLACGGHWRRLPGRVRRPVEEAAKVEDPVERRVALKRAQRTARANITRLAGGLRDPRAPGEVT